MGSRGNESYGIPWAELDALVDWRLKSPSIRRKFWDQEKAYSPSRVDIEELGVMQKTYSLELRVDFKDKDKFEVMRKLFQQAALHLSAQADLLMDHVPAQAAVFDDDFFSGKQQISILDDTIGKGKEMMAALTTPQAEEADAPSADLLNELRKLQDPSANE